MDMKLNTIAVAFAAMLLIGCGGNGDKSQSVATFDAKSALVLDEGDTVTFDLAGSIEFIDDGNVVEMTGTYSLSGMELTMFQSVQTKAIRQLVTLKSEASGMTFSSVDTSYYDESGGFIGSEDEDEVVCYLDSQGELTSSESVGSTGIGAAFTCSDGESSESVWRLQSAPNSLADLIFTETATGGSASGSTEFAYRINGSGELLGISTNEYYNNGSDRIRLKMKSAESLEL